MHPLHTIAAALVFSVSISMSARAQSALSVTASALPVASLVGTTLAAGASGAAVLTAGAVLTVKAVGASAQSVTYVLERASDGARVSVQIASNAAGATALALETSVTVSAIGTGLVLVSAGQALAYLPNQVGRSLMHHEKISQ